MEGNNRNFSNQTKENQKNEPGQKRPTTGEDRWPGDPEKLKNQEASNSGAEVWDGGTNYVTPSKWQDSNHGKVDRPGYFNNYQSEDASDKKEHTDDSVSRSMN